MVLDGTTRIQLHGGVVLQGLQQQAVQVGAVDGGIGGAVALHGGRAQRHRGQGVAAQRATHLQLIRKSRHRLQGPLQAPGLQAPHGVRPQLHTRAHLAELRRTLVQPHIPPCTCRTERSRQPPDAATGHQYLLVHANEPRNRS